MVHALQSEAEQRQRAAALARMQRLPDGVTAVSAPSSGTACHVCGEEDEADDNVLLQVMGFLALLASVTPSVTPSVLGPSAANRGHIQLSCCAVLEVCQVLSTRGVTVIQCL